jgi:hypothetical protein
MRFFNDPDRIPQSYGVRIAIGLIAYFVVMYFLDLAHEVELRLLNLLILVTGVYLALKRFRETNGNNLNYFRALVTGVSTAAIGALIFSSFLFLFMTVDETLMSSIRQNEPMGRFMNPYIASCVVALEGIFSGLLVTFILINYVSTDEVNQPQG